MLYDILPPLLFFVSLAGMTAVISRVLMRLKRSELSAAIQTEGASGMHSAQQLFNPGESKVTFMKSRLTAVGNSVAQSVSEFKKVMQKKQPSVAITAPRSTWRERFTRIQNRLKAQLKRIKRKPRLVALPVSPPPAPVQPRVTLQRVEKPPVPTRLETTTQRLQALVKKSRATTSPVQAAQQALSGKNLAEAEDILVPYLAKHPKNTVAYLLLSEIAVVRGRWDEAIEILEQVIQLDRTAPGAYAKLGEAALAGGRVTRALEALQRAHDADPKDISVLKNLFKIAQRRDDRVLQKSVVHRMVLLAPDDPEVHSAAEIFETREAQREQTPAA